jgi:hypothetical protein
VFWPLCKHLFSSLIKILSMKHLVPCYLQLFSRMLRSINMVHPVPKTLVYDTDMSSLVSVSVLD